MLFRSNDEVNIKTVMGGTKFNSLEFNFGSLPFTFNISKIFINNLSFGQIKSFGLVRNFSTN